jgi:cytochrome c oxidase subunit 2
VHKWWSILFGAVMAAAAVLWAVSPLFGWWVPKSVSSFGGAVDNLYYLILAITGFFFILTEAILVYNIYRFAGAPERRGTYIHGNHKLEVFWTAVPGAILLLIALLQVRTWEDIKYRSRMPAPDQVFEVSARQFEWRMRYPTAEQLETMVGPWKSGKEPESARQWAAEPHADDIHIVNGVHTWQGANVRLYLRTRDVLHSFYLPNLRLKQDAVPGKIIPVWFQPTEYNTVYDENAKTWVDGYDPQKQETGHNTQVWDLACAELCGWGHYKMQGRLFVHKDKADYLKWLAQVQQEQSRHQPGESTTTTAR